jgi:hypothetical protein
MMAPDSNAVANDLSEWFQSVQRLANDNLFSIAPEGPHRDAAVLDALRRNARIVAGAELHADGKLYPPLCFFLAAACRLLRTTLGVGHWRSALDNIRAVQQQLAHSLPESISIGLDLGTPATLFKAEFDEAIRQAGLVEQTSFLSKEVRQIALGLAINWGIRLLLAYAGEVPQPTQPSKNKDLAWLGERLSSAEPTCPELPPSPSVTPHERTNRGFGGSGISTSA